MRIILVVPAMALVASCSAGSATEDAPGAPGASSRASQPGSSEGLAVPSQADASPADGAGFANQTAEQIAIRLADVGVPLSTTAVYAADSDPNVLLGRPGGYASKINFADTRIPSAQVDHLGPDALARGGSVEVYQDADGALARQQYIVDVMTDNPAYTEYTYVSGGVLVRVSRLLTADQVGMYEQVLAEFGGGVTSGTLPTSPDVVPTSGSGDESAVGEITDLY